MSPNPTLPAAVGLEMRWLQPLYGRLSHRPDLIATLEQEAGLRRAEPSDLGLMAHSDFCHLLERLYESGDPHVCAWLALGFDASVGFGQVYFLRSCSHLREMLSDLITHQPLLFPFGPYQFSVDWDSSSFEVQLEPAFPSPRLASRLLAEGAMAWVKRIFDLSLSMSIAPISVRSSVPSDKASGELAQWLGAPVAFDAGQCAMRFAHHLLDEPFPGGNLRIKQAMRAGFGALLRHTDAPIPLPLRLISGFQAHGNEQKITIESVAARLCISATRLRCELQASGMRFSDILNAYRRRQAFQLLVQEGSPVEAVVPELGYSSRFALERAFTGWFGTSPANARLHRMQLTTLALSEDWCDPVALLRLVPVPSDRILDMSALEDAQLPASPLLQAHLLGMANRAEYGGRAVVDLSQLTPVIGGDQLNCLLRALHLQAASGETTPAIVALMQSRQGAARRLQASPWFVAMDEGARRRAALDVALYELGALLLYRRFGTPYADLLLAASATRRSELLRAEVQGFGMDRHTAAATLLAAWGLPREVIQVQRDASELSTPYARELARWMELPRQAPDDA